MTGNRATKPLRYKFLDQIVQQIVLQNGEVEPGADLPLNEHGMPVLNMDRIIRHYVSDEAVQLTKKERNKAIASKEDYKERCKRAEEKARDLRADKEAIKKSLTKKIIKINRDLDRERDEAQQKFEALQKELCLLQESHAKLQAELQLQTERLAHTLERSIKTESVAGSSDIAPPKAPLPPVQGGGLPAPPPPPMIGGPPPPPPPPPPMMGGPPPPPPPPGNYDVFLVMSLVKTSFCEFGLQSCVGRMVYTFLCILFTKVIHSTLRLQARQAQIVYPRRRWRQQRSAHSRRCN